MIVPCYNHARFIAEAIESVLAQTYRSFEVIVVDDGSTDATPDVVARYATVRYLRQENRGVSSARNLGLRASAGDYVVFLDADDRLLPRALEVGLAALVPHPDAAFAVGLSRHIDEAGRPLPTRTRARVDGDYYASLLRRGWITMPTVMHRRTILEREGGFDESLRHSEDYELYLRLTRRSPIVDHYTEVAEYRQHPDTLTAESRRMLEATLTVLDRHRPAPDAPPSHHAAYRLREHAVWFYDRVLDDALGDLSRGRLGSGLVKLLAFVHHLPRHRGYVLRRLATPARLLARALRARRLHVSRATRV